MTGSPTEHAEIAFAWTELETARITMGSDDPAAPDDERPSRQVTVGALAVTPMVTVEQWRQFVGATGYRTVAEVEGSSFATCVRPGDPVPGLNWRTGTTGSPVTHVAWIDAWEFCRWAGVRLLTEAEWARMAGAPADSFETSSRWTWCDDWYSADFFRDEQRVNPTGPTSGTHRVARGGGSAITRRAAVLPDLSAADLGFQVVQRR